jgi:hypothetical protein
MSAIYPSNITASGTAKLKDVTTTGNVVMSQANVSALTAGTVTCPKFKLTQVWQAYNGGAHPLSATFTSNGGTLKFDVTTQMHINLGTGLWGAYYTIDAGSTVAFNVAWTDQMNSHYSTSCSFVISGLAAGTHTIKAANYNTALGESDQNDRQAMVITEFPF